MPKDKTTVSTSSVKSSSPPLKHEAVKKSVSSRQQHAQLVQ